MIDSKSRLNIPNENYYKTLERIKSKEKVANKTITIEDLVLVLKNEQEKTI